MPWIRRNCLDDGTTVTIARRFNEGFNLRAVMDASGSPDRQMCHAATSGFGPPVIDLLALVLDSQAASLRVTPAVQDRPHDDFMATSAIYYVMDNLKIWLAFVGQCPIFLALGFVLS